MCLHHSNLDEVGAFLRSYLMMLYFIDHVIKHFVLWTRSALGPIYFVAH